MRCVETEAYVIGDLPTQASLDGFLKDLVREGQREWISEGQLFYLYKRLNFEVKRGRRHKSSL